MRRLTGLALFVALAGSAVRAQGAGASEPPLLIRQHLVAPGTLQPIRVLGVPGYVREARWLHDAVYVLDDLTIDAAAGELLGVSADRLVLRAADGAARWSVAATDVHAAASAGPEQRLLFADRVVLARAGGGLVGLDRKTGALIWQRTEVPSAVVVADGSLVITAGPDPLDGKPAFAVLAIANGAPSAHGPLAAVPRQVVPGPQGIAFVGPAAVVVHDRTGPRLFEHAGTTSACAAGADGWFVIAEGKAEAWSRTGGVRWRTTLPPLAMAQGTLCATPAGDVLVVDFVSMADSGFAVRCLGGDDGGTRWSFTEPGLGVAHSKYWHRVQVRTLGADVLVTSQAAGGCFAVRFDPLDAGGRRRQKFEF